MKWVILLLLPLGCGLSDPLAPNGDPKCDSTQLGKLTALYASELQEVCSSHEELEECTDKERDPVDQKYEKLFREWAECE